MVRVPESVVPSGAVWVTVCLASKRTAFPEPAYSQPINFQSSFLSNGSMGGIARSSARKLYEIARGLIVRIVVIRFAAVHIVLNACLGKHEVHFVVLL